MPVYWNIALLSKFAVKKHKQSFQTAMHWTKEKPTKVTLDNNVLYNLIQLVKCLQIQKFKSAVCTKLGLLRKGNYKIYSSIDFWYPKPILLNHRDNTF